MQLTPYCLFLDYFNCFATLIAVLILMWTNNFEIFFVLCGQAITKYLQSVNIILLKSMKILSTTTVGNWMRC